MFSVVVVSLAASTAEPPCSAQLQTSLNKRAATVVRKPRTMNKLQYPQSRRDTLVEEYHGTSVPAPYRWLENVNSDETKQWVNDQNQVTHAFLDGIESRQPIRERLESVWNYERFGMPVIRGDRVFYKHNDGLQNQSVLYWADSLSGERRVLIDPNELSDEGTVALASWSVSPNGKLLAYGLQRDGSDWREWHVRDIESGEVADDHLKWVKFSGVSWSPDNSGFFYSRYDEPRTDEEFTGSNYFQKLYFHHLGDDQSDDQLIYERQDEKEWGFSGYVTESGDYLIISVWKGSGNKNQLFYKSLTDSDADVVELINKFDFEYSFVGHDATSFYFMTDDNAKKRRVISIDIENPNKDQWQEIIPESSDTLEDISLFGDTFIVSYLHKAHSRIERYSISGESLGTIELPGIGSAGGFGGRRDQQTCFFSFSNYTQPYTIYQYDIESNESSVYKKADVDINSDNFETKQVLYKSKDGTEVSMFISHKKGMTLDGSNPTILYGYGGFDISLTPGFSVTNMVWMEMGGVYAVANIRGGGEYGKDWHEAGKLVRRQNSFDDFISAAEYLISEKYTCTERLAIKGGSNGGLLVGAVMCQRPELFGATLPAVGVMDMLRYHKFTIGWAWVSEFGSSDDQEHFKFLYKYSPLHNLTRGTRYPSTLVTTSDHDDRVVPGHSFKFAAALQHAHKGKNPVLIRIETNAGHGAGTATSKRIDAAADIFAFLTRTLGFQPQLSN
tara:strand:+ start:962 stop:3148 length:2187 start_codon:yes stop_codon:yes gene_type:complete